MCITHPRTPSFTELLFNIFMMKINKNVPIFTVMPLGTTKTLVADVLAAVVDMLTPYTEYTVFVVGMTEGGEGESSTIITVTTLQDGKGIIMLVFQGLI